MQIMHNLVAVNLTGGLFAGNSRAGAINEGAICTHPSRLRRLRVDTIVAARVRLAKREKSQGNTI